MESFSLFQFYIHRCESNIFRLSVNGTVPKKIEVGDEIIIKGKLEADWDSFSVNFIREDANDILYHFKVNKTSSVVIQNSKRAKKNAWFNEIASTNDKWVQSLENDFTVAFRFDDEIVKVYTGTVNCFPILRGRPPFYTIHSFMYLL